MLKVNNRDTIAMLWLEQYFYFLTGYLHYKTITSQNVPSEALLLS